jgi:signal transduction histidine kinase
MSLRGRIVALSVGVAASVLLLFAVPLVLLLRQTAIEDGREKATDVAQSVADYVSAGAVDDQVLSDYVDRINKRDDAFPVEVALADGSSIGATLPGVDPTDPDADGCRADPDSDGDQDGDSDDDGDGHHGLRPTSQAGVRDVHGGELVVITVETDTGGQVAVCAYSSESRAHKTISERLVLLGGAALLLLLASAAAGLFVARRLVRHLTAAAETADSLGDGDLTARVPDEGPSEVRRVGAALNRLAGRIDELLLAERETVADLSHRLRTPLTAVRLDVESLPDSDRKSELEEHLSQLERTLTAVIHAARRPEREGARPHCDAAEIVGERFEFWAALAEDQGRRTQLDIATALQGSAGVHCAAADLRSAVDALLENAIAHTAEGTDISVVLIAEDSEHLRLDVRDRGPGVPLIALRRGLSDRGSSGLGLDIARSCAQASGGALELIREDGWAVVRLLLGRSSTQG